MIILWVSKRKTEEPKGSSSRPKASFQEHDMAMRKFRLNHPDINIIDSRDIMTADGNLLAPVQKVKFTAHMQN